MLTVIVFCLAGCNISLIDEVDFMSFITGSNVCYLSERSDSDNELYQKENK